jgi:hypothetical protein
MQQKRDTAANWTANNPTLLAGQIGFETDTNKIKIGDGSTAWTGLSYFAGSGGGGETLAQTLALGSTTGGTPITVSNNDYIQSHVSNKGRIQFLNNGQEVAITTDGTGYVTPYLYLSQTQAQLIEGSNAVTVQSANIDLYHSSLIKLRATDVELTNETASRILSTDGSKYITALDTATYPSLTELSYVKGATSAIQTQLNAKQDTITTGTAAQYLKGDLSLGTYQGYVVHVGCTNSTPADATTYFIGGHFGTTILTTTANTLRVYFPKAGTIKAIYVTFTQGVGTNEASTISFRLNDTTDTQISAAVDNSAAQTTVSNTSLSIAVAQGDFGHIKWVTPTWVTNPTGLRIFVSIYVE